MLAEKQNSKSWMEGLRRFQHLVPDPLCMEVYCGFSSRQAGTLIGDLIILVEDVWNTLMEAGTNQKHVRMRMK